MRFRCYLCGGTFPEAGPHGWIPHVLQTHSGSLTARMICRALVQVDLPPPWATTPRPSSLPQGDVPDAVSGEVG
jgi:hypothetical protein